MRRSIWSAAAAAFLAVAGSVVAQAPATPPTPADAPPTTVSPVTVVAPRPLPPGPPRLELYEQRGFEGGGVILVGSERNLLTRGFSDRARSARVFGSAWQVCNGPDFAPPCAVLSQDSSFLGELQLSQRVSSARPLVSSAPAR